MPNLNGGRYSRATTHGDHTDSLNPSLDYHDDSYTDTYVSYFVSEGGPSGYGWRARINRGEAVTSGITGWQQVFKYVPGRGEVTFNYDYPYTTNKSRSNTVDSGFLTGIPATVDPGGFSVADVDDRAIMAVVSKLQNAKSQLQGLVVLGELGETLRMIRSPAMALRSSVNTYHSEVLKRISKATRRSGPIGSGGKLLKRASVVRDVVANTWLEYSFGWRPLIMDVKNGAEAAAKLVHKPSIDYRVVSGSSMKEAADTDQLTQTNRWGGKILVRNLGKQRVKVKYTAMVSVNLNTAGSVPDVMQTLGADWSSILPAAWELIPYSFLVDYFTNVGDLISAISFPAGFVKWVVRNQLQEYESSLASVGFIPADPSTIDGLSWSMSGSYGKTTRTYRVVNRSAFTGPLIPNFVIRMPGAGSTRWLNILALAALRNIPGLRRSNPNKL